MVYRDKELLLKDLCARLPYGVKLNGKRIAVLSSIETSINGVWLTTRHYHAIGCTPFKFHINSIEHHLPYLRPMSSMTKEEREEYMDVKMQETERVALAEVYRPEVISIIFDWLNSHHFDYRGLIEKGLAIAVTEENNFYK